MRDEEIAQGVAGGWFAEYGNVASGRGPRAQDAVRANMEDTVARLANEGVVEWVEGPHLFLAEDSRMPAPGWAWYGVAWKAGR